MSESTDRQSGLNAPSLRLQFNVRSLFCLTLTSAMVMGYLKAIDGSVLEATLGIRVLVSGLVGSLPMLVALTVGLSSLLELFCAVLAGLLLAILIELVVWLESKVGFARDIFTAAILGVVILANLLSPF